MDVCLEKIHPCGKLLEGPQLREEFTKLVSTVKHLYEESCCLLHDRGDKLKLREDLESKLSASLANTELEMRRCVMYDTASGSLVYLQALEGDQVKYNLTLDISLSYICIYFLFCRNTNAKAYSG